MINRLVIIGMLAFLCQAFACTDLGTEPPVNVIVWNSSVDGVRLGDDSATVIRKLGPANYITIGDFAGYILFYSSGPHAGLSVTIWTRQTTWGIGTRSIGVSAPYAGTTKDGIGLGSTQEQVRGIIGSPTRSLDSQDEYLEDAQRTIVRYTNGKITSIVLIDPEPS